MRIRAILIRAAAAAALVQLTACGEPERGPVVVSAIGGAPELVNPNLQPLDPPRAFLAEATAQGLVRFDAAGEIEPGLARSWIVSDDGLRYTFRIRRTAWADGERVTAEQVVRRLRAAISPASRNPLKPMLGVVEEVVAMTDEVLEISLAAPRPNFLQLLAQPELAVVRAGHGTGPYRAEPQPGGAMLLTPVADPDLDAPEEAAEPGILLHGERAGRAVARFAMGRADLVTGGTAGDLPLVRAANLPAAALRFDPVSGLFGLAFLRESGLVAAPEVRQALAMAIDREALVATLGVRGLQPRLTLLPPGNEDFPEPAAVEWAGQPMAMRRERAARAIAAAADGDAPPTLRVAMPDEPGFRILFAYLRRDWRAIGVEAERVAPGEAADLALVDEVAPAALASWYLRRFTCERSRVCSAEADERLAAARLALDPEERRALLAEADRLLTDLVPFIPVAAPVRWSLVSPRLTGFRANVFARHGAIELVAPRQ
jgi:oligopeptide transport system substrate-binding protein